MRINGSFFICGILIGLLCLVLVVQAQTQCPSACTCMLPSDAAKMKGYSLCGGKQILCGYDKAHNPLYCYQKPAPTTPIPTPTPLQYAPPTPIEEDFKETPTPMQYSETIVTAPTPMQYSKTIVITPTPTPMQYSETIGGTPTPGEVYPQTIITCPENCTCMAESSARVQGRSSCGVPVWAGGCEGLACEWCGDQGGEDMYCFSNITREAVVGTSPQNELPLVIAPTTEISSLKEPFTTTPPLVAPPATGETAESPGGMVIPLGFQSVIGAIVLAVLVIGLFSAEKNMK